VLSVIHHDHDIVILPLACTKNIRQRYSFHNACAVRRCLRCSQPCQLLVDIDNNVW